MRDQPFRLIKFYNTVKLKNTLNYRILSEIIKCYVSLKQYMGVNISGTLPK